MKRYFPCGWSWLMLALTVPAMIALAGCAGGPKSGNNSGTGTTAPTTMAANGKLTLDEVKAIVQQAVNGEDEIYNFMHFTGAVEVADGNDTIDIDGIGYLLVTDKKFQTMDQINVYLRGFYTKAYIKANAEFQTPTNETFLMKDGKMYRIAADGGGNGKANLDTMKLITQTEDSLRVTFERYDAAEVDTLYGTEMLTLKKANGKWFIDGVEYQE